VHAIAPSPVERVPSSVVCRPTATP
jgi:hypothetical protein